MVPTKRGSLNDSREPGEGARAPVPCATAEPFGVHRYLLWMICPTGSTPVDHNDFGINPQLPLEDSPPDSPDLDLSGDAHNGLSCNVFRHAVRGAIPRALIADARGWHPGSARGPSA